MRETFAVKAALLAGTLVVPSLMLAPSALAGPSSPPFTQCPAIGLSPSCAVLIIVGPGGVTVLGDPSVGPYDGSEDTLVGVENRTASALTTLPLTSTKPIFGFDGDGLCSGFISPHPAACPFGPTGYEGPNTSFTVTDFLHGSVNFPAGLAPGASTYFSLEERLDAADIVVGPADKCPARTPTIVGTAGNDQIVGTPGDDVIFGLGGNDQIDGGGGNDLICGNDGNDSLNGGISGNDELYGDAGDDALDGANGNDKLFGGVGRDRMAGADGDDQLTGGADVDRMTGDNGTDKLTDSDGTPGDILDGGPAADSCTGSPGDYLLNCNP